MTVKAVQSGIQPVQEFILDRNDYSMSVPASTQDQFESLDHNLGLSPFVDFMISADGGTTFYDPTQFQTIDSLIYCDMFCDENKIYFSYHYSSGSPANPALSLIFRYTLYITEAAR